MPVVAVNVCSLLEDEPPPPPEAEITPPLIVMLVPAVITVPSAANISAADPPDLIKDVAVKLNAP